jgi:exopolysaccharide production protein ExoQ
MATTVIQGLPPRTRSLRLMPQLVLGWVLMIPLAFYAVHGTPSFEGAGNATDRASSLSALASTGRSGGIVGSVVIPGVAFSIVMWLLLINAKRVLSLALQMRMITLLALFTICSALWSQQPFRSAYNGVFYLIETLFAFYLVQKFDSEEILSIFSMAGASIAVLCLVMVFLFPKYGVVHSARDGLAWVGLFTDRTMIGKCMVFLLSPALVFGSQRIRYGRAIYILLMLIMVYMAHAATARVILVLYIAFMASISISSRFGRRSSVLVAGLFLVAGALVIGGGLAFLPRVLEALGRNATLSGRTQIWSLLLESIGKRPLLGYGFYAFWLGMTGESANAIVGAHWMFGYAHNGILEICLQLGLVGTLLFFVTLLQAIGNAWCCLRNGCPPGVKWYVGLIALTILYNIDESTVLWPIDILSIMYLVACSGLAIAARKIRSVKMIEAIYN